ncbi:ATPase family AAA domain-containing protein 5 [Talaromyces islandicus]|uniref:ATPase family AAA domain-containing protein 5 n=1 Tax=Talaromyces islandicus TaxID=28573 RepID=A0A0U1LMU2_TALIS|nr:ATPase family AAA domain-containing protein 5 [Talaromyces islandicus]
MASAVADRVMGQAEQQKLHPFFGQYPKPSHTPGSPLLPPSHEAVPTFSQDPTPTPSEPYSIGGTTKTFQKAALPTEPPSQDTSPRDDSDTHRRKRLKTSDSSTTPADEATSAPQNAPAPSSTSLVQENMHPASPPRKILKLNTNGKLLSSPPAQRTETRETRGRPKRAAKKDKSRIITIKYNSKDIGQNIDSILRGSERLKPPTSSVTKAIPAPPKATHPFFLKKPTSQLSRETLSATAENLDNKQGSIEPKPQQQTNWQSQFSRSILPKFPEPIAPIWPPRDLVHVRGVEVVASNALTVALPDRRKNKERILRVDDSENILLVRHQQVWREIEDASKAELSPLRLPTRSVASGLTLQKDLDSQLSHGPNSQNQHVPGYCGEQGRQHPAIAKLYTSIATSMTAFDTGKYDTVQWAHKYAPVTADEVLQAGPEARMLRDWLKNLKISSVDTGKTSSGKKSKHSTGRKTKRRKAANKLDGFIVSSEDEASEMSELSDGDDDELAADFGVSSKRTVIRVGDSVGKFKKGDNSRMTNALLISGPNGCGKSASVYAVAQELDFEVFEINSGNRRSAKDILERVGDMTQNHLIQLDGMDRQEDELNIEPQPIDVKQNKLNAFFKAKPASKAVPQGARTRKDSDNDNPQKKLGYESARSQKQSLILLEEVDVLFEEDKQFWMGVLALISQSKRPVIMTCNNEELIPLQDLTLHAILRYRPPHPQVAVDYLLVLAANEGHMLQREAVKYLYLSCNQDLRKSIVDLDFWCQMAVGSQKSGIDWILDRWSQGADIDANGEKLKVTSLQTYQRFMGWFSRDHMLTKDSLVRETELLVEGMNWWQLELDAEQEAELTSFVSATSNSSGTHLEQLQRAAILAESHSALDILSHSWSLNQTKDDLDASISDLSEKQKSNYQEGYPLLNAICKADYTGLSANIGSTAQVLMQRTMFDEKSQENEVNAKRILARQSRSKSTGFSTANYISAFESIMQSNDSILVHAASSSESDVAGVVQDIAPYIRSIMAFDLRLERYRLQLSGIMSEGPRNKRVRKTRASRAALEGGDKSNTRRERWFSQEANPKQILATGSSEWQDALVQTGHFSVAPVALGSASSGQSDSENSEGASRVDV